MKTTDMRALSLQDRHDRRVRVIQLRLSGDSYERIAAQTGLSRTGVFDICKRHTARGASALDDAPRGHRAGAGRTLTRSQESLLMALIAAHTPDEIAIPEVLWTRQAVGHLIELRLGMRLPVRTLDAYLARWGYPPRRQPGRNGQAVSAVLSRWLSTEYPRVAVQCRAQGGEISWADQHEVAGEGAQAPAAAEPPAASVSRIRGRHPRLSMIGSVTNTGHRRWNTFVGALDAPILIDFLGRVIKDARRKVFLIMDDMQVRDERPVAQWLAEHEDDIQTFDLPLTGPGLAA